MKDVLFWGNELKTSLKEMKRAEMGGYREFTDLEHGTALVWDLHRDENGHCMRSFMSKGTIFPLHDHKESWETIVLYRGAIDIIFKNKDGEKEVRSMEIGRPAFLLNGQNHKILVREDSWVYAILIPPDENM